jgi:beta-glucosidase
VGDGFTQVTAFPSALCAAASWDAALLEAFGDAMGAEQFGKGVNVMLGPGTNLIRVPLNGRMYEYFAEEPALSAAAVAAVVRGVQTKNNVSVTVKHFVANSQEWQRGNEDAQVGERALHEMYAPSYLAAAAAGAGAFMLGVNKVRGLENSANAETMGLLFEAGFEGFFMTDWAGIVVPNASAAAWAGTSVEMPRGYQYEFLPLFIANGSVPIAVIDGLVTRVLTAAAALGLLDTPPAPATRNPGADVMTPAHVALARTLAARGAVLLKNAVPVGDAAPLLPLDRARLPRGVLVLGDETTVAGCGSGEVQRPYVVTPFQGLYAALAPNATRPVNCTVYADVDFFQDGAACRTVTGAYPAGATAACCALCTATSGCNAWTVVPGAACPGQPLAEPNQCFLKPDTAGERAHPGISSGTCAPLPPSDPPLSFYGGQNASVAAALAATVDAVVFVAATPSVEPNPGCEGNDRLTLALPPWQDAVIAAVAAANARVVVVTRTGGAALMPWLAAVPAVVHQGLAGQEAGNALADILLGAENPGGKLTVSFPAADNATWLTSAAQYPGVYNASSTYWETSYSEGLLVGYRFYDATPAATAALFAFGHGLSFSQFVFSALAVSGTVSPNSNATVSVRVTNVAGPAGREVAQLYVAGQGLPGDPVRTLKGFAPTGLLAPGASADLSFTLTAQALSYFDEAAAAWAPFAPGSYSLWVGAGSRDLRLQGSVAVARAPV